MRLHQLASRTAGTIEDRLSHYCQLLTVEIWQSLYCPANVLKPWDSFQVLIMCVICWFLCMCMHWVLLCLTIDVHASAYWTYCIAGIYIHTYIHYTHTIHMCMQLQCARTFLLICVRTCLSVHWLACQLMSPVIQQWACCGLVAGSRGWESHSRLQLSLAGRKARMPSLYCLHTGWSLEVCARCPHSVFMSKTAKGVCRVYVQCSTLRTPFSASHYFM